MDCKNGCISKLPPKPPDKARTLSTACAGVNCLVEPEPTCFAHTGESQTQWKSEIPTIQRGKKKTKGHQQTNLDKGIDGIERISESRSQSDRSGGGDRVLCKHLVLEELVHPERRF